MEDREWCVKTEQREMSKNGKRKLPHGSYFRLSWEDEEERSDWGRDTMLSELLR